MNYIFRILSFAFFSALLVGCLGDSEELTEIATSEAATLNVEPGGTVIKNVTQQISFNVALSKLSDPSLVQSAEVYVTFEGANNIVAATKINDITTFPSEVTLTISDLLSQAGLTLEEFSAGDTWNYSYNLNSNSGKVWDIPAVTQFTFTCPSDIAGEYSAVTSGQSTDGCCTAPVADLTSTVTLTEERPGVYVISDFSAGLYFEWYVVYGITGPADTPGKLQHVCSTVSIVETSEPFGTAVTGSGTYDDSNGVITYTWSNGFADMGTVTLTPKQ